MNKQNEKGFTMVELIIVVAIMGIIGAMLIPSFAKMSAKAKLTTDISTTKTLQRLVESYNAEYSPAEIPSNLNLAGIATSLSAVGLLDNSTVEVKTSADYIGTDASGHVRFKATAVSAAGGKLGAAMADMSAKDPSLMTIWCN